MKKVILVTGMSGAGKTTAMKILDDMGYHCIDRFPVELLDSLYALINNDDSYNKVCLSTNAFDYSVFYNFFKQKKVPTQTIFLDCNDEQLILRYKFTRRQHPFLAANLTTTLDDAIKKERSFFANIFTKDAKLINTTKMTNYELKEVIESFAKIDQKISFSVSFVSFGFKYGIPQDCDFMLDIRYLPNPYYEEHLKHLTGNEIEVYDYVMNSMQSQETLEKLFLMCDYLLAQYEKDGRSHVSIAIGCTGGKHRSVSFVNELFEKYSRNYHCFKKHRDIEVH